MKKVVWFILGILACLVIAGGAYFWATGLISSLYNYRSPLHSNPPAAGQPVGPIITHKVIMVLIDALRNDTSLKPEVMPFLNELRQQSAVATMHSRPPSYSEPGYSVLLTGAWPDISDGPAMNLDYVDIPTWTQDNLFSAAHRASLKTAVSGYNWFEKLIPHDTVTASFYTPGEDNAADQEVLSAALPMLDGPYQFVLIHIDQVDYAGHYEGGPRDPRWDAAARRSDDLLREIVTKLDLKQDTVLVLSDHGQIDRGGHGGQESIVLIEPFVMAGAGIKPGHYPDIQMVDVAPTIAVLLGTNIPASNEGHVLTDMFNLNTVQRTTIQAALKTQQGLLFTDYTKAIGETSKVAQSIDVVTATQVAMDKARFDRLFRDQTWRGLFALILAVIPAAIMVIRKDRKVLWLLGGSLLYVLLFNLRYSVLSGRTYSLSSVASQTDIIMFTAITAAIEFSLVWLVVLLILHAFQQGPFRAAGSALSFTLMTIYILSLPILLSFALNGVFITWTLPDFLTMFLGFLFVLQSLIIAALGLILTGLTGAIAAIVPKSRRIK